MNSYLLPKLFKHLHVHRQHIGWWVLQVVSHVQVKFAPFFHSWVRKSHHLVNFAIRVHITWARYLLVTN